MALEDYYNSPEITQAIQGVDTAMANVTNYSSQASLLPQKLKQAIQEKLDFNRDLIEQRNKAQAEYYQAPSAARAKFADPTSANYIFNPFQAEKLVDVEKAMAYEPYANLSDILSQRQGTIADTVQAGTAAFQSQVQAAQAEAERAGTKLDTLLKLAQLKEGASVSEQDLAIKRASLAKGTEADRGRAVLNNLAKSVMLGATLDEVMRTYSTELPTADILRIYNINSPYGTAKESAKELQSKYGIEYTATEMKQIQSGEDVKSLIDLVNDLKDNGAKKVRNMFNPLDKEGQYWRSKINLGTQQIAKLIEQSRLSDADRLFYLEQTSPQLQDLIDPDLYASRLKGVADALTTKLGVAEKNSRPDINNNDPLGIMD